MNQILSVEQPKKEIKQKVKSNEPIEINKIVKFFAISMIIFGIVIISSASYSMYKGTQVGNTQAKPTIYVEDISESQLKLQVSHTKPLQKVTYSWNNEEPVDLEAKGKKKVEQTIEIPTGENTLNVYAIDQNGKEISYPKTYTRQGEMNINFEVDGANLKIIAEGKEQLAYMTYRWDEEEEKTIEINDIKTEQSIEIPKGQHKLTVVVVDINNKTETKEQEVKGVTKPKLEITTDGSANFIINASDEEGISKIEFIINEKEKYVLDLTKAFSSVEQRKQISYPYPLHDGENKLEVTVYNDSGITETQRVKVNK